MPRKKPTTETPEAPREFPGATPTPSATAARQVVVGRYAICTLAGATLVNLFDWEVNVNFDYADATAHGDLWKQKVFLDADWTARGRGYLVPATTNQYIKSATSSSVPVALAFIGYSDTTSTTVLWSGNCFISRGRITVPMGLAEQEIELVSSGIPTGGLG